MKSSTENKCGETIELTGTAYGGVEEMCVWKQTPHIAINGSVLCGDSTVQEKHDTGVYEQNETRHPLAEREVCDNCAAKYVNEHGSNDDVFNRVVNLEKGDWIRFSTNSDAETLTGRVYWAPDANDHPTRTVKVVVSNEPRKRWHATRIDHELLLKKREGEQMEITPPTLEDESSLPVESHLVTDIQQIEPPKNNIDVQTRDVIAELESVNRELINKVDTISENVEKFMVKGVVGITSEEIQFLVGALEADGYEVTDTLHGTGEKQDGGATIFVACSELR